MVKIDSEHARQALNKVSSVDQLGSVTCYHHPHMRRVLAVLAPLYAWDTALLPHLYTCCKTSFISCTYEVCSESLIRFR